MKNRLTLIHEELIHLLEIEGITLDDIYYCPHHTEGIKKQYMIDCSCRKPKPGMLYDAAKQHNIDLTQSLMIGDSEVDMLAGEGAGCTCVLIKNADEANMSVDAIEYIDYRVKDLREAAQCIPVSNKANIANTTHHFI